MSSRIRVQLVRSCENASDLPGRLGKVAVCGFEGPKQKLARCTAVVGWHLRLFVVESPAAGGIMPHRLEAARGAHGGACRCEHRRKIPERIVPCSELVAGREGTLARFNTQPQRLCSRLATDDSLQCAGQVALLLSGQFAALEVGDCRQDIGRSSGHGARRSEPRSVTKRHPENRVIAGQGAKAPPLNTHARSPP